MMEIDWSVGEIMKALQNAGLDDNTLVFFSSDNGPWTSYGNHAGKTPFREAKATGFDGGTRSACILRYPGQDQSRHDFERRRSAPSICFPRLAHLAGAKLPKNPIDGLDVWDLIIDKPGAKNPARLLCVLAPGKIFEGVISGDGHWKLHLPHDYRRLVEGRQDGKPGK